MACVLHIGTNKTGTSTLQKYLSSYREELLRAGIRYPKLPGHPRAHHALAFAIRDDDFSRYGIDAGAIAEIVGKDDAISIFSSEAFHTIRDVNAVAQIFPPEQTKVVLYAREHVAYMASWYQQSVQARTITCSFVDFAQMRATSLSALIHRWKSVYGGNLCVRHYERSQLLNTDIVADFFSAALDKPPPVERKFGDKNPTISGNLLFLKLLMNYFLTAEQNTSIVEELNALSYVDPRFSGPLHVTEAEARRVAYLNAADRRRLNEEFEIRLKPPLQGMPGSIAPDLVRLQDDLVLLMSHAKAAGFACHQIFKDNLDLLGLPNPAL